MTYITNRKGAPARALVNSSAMGTAAASVLATVMLGHAAPAVAQTATPPSTATTMAPVKTTADTGNEYKANKLESPKFTQPLVDTTQTVQVITQQTMRDQQATTLTDAMRNVAGAGTFFAGENGSTSTGDTIYLRGFDTSNSIYIDGIRDTASVKRDMFNTESVEVIKGPSGSDYGRSAPSGSINLNTKQAKLEDSFDLSTGIGSARYKRGTLDWNRQLGDTSAFRLNVMGLDSDQAGRNQIENNRWGIAPSLAWGLGTDNRVYLNFMHVRQTNVPDGGIPTIGLPGYSAPSAALGWMNNAPRVDTNNFYGTTSDHDYVDTDMATIRFEHDFNAETTLRNTTRWARTKENYLLTSFLVSAPTAPYTSGIQPGYRAGDPYSLYVARTPTLKNVSNRILTNQTNLTTKFNTGSLKHDVSAGFELTRETQYNYGLSAATEAPVNLYDPDSSVSAMGIHPNGADAHAKTDTVAAYIFDTVEMNDWWQVNGGIRLDHYRTTYDSATACGGTGRNVVSCNGAPTGSPVGTIDTKASGNLVDWKLGTLFRVAANGNVYANYGVSQQPPGGSTFTLAADGANANSPDFKPQKAKTAELGTKWELFDRNLLASAALFRTEVENDVQTESDGTISQTAKKKVQGLELGLAGQFTENWSATAGYTIQNATVDNGPSVTQNGGNNLSYTPKHAFSAWTTYKLPYGFRLGGGARYVGSMDRGTDGAVGTPDHVQSYWVFDAMAGYQATKNLDFQFNVYNLFNKDYVAAINKSGYRYFPGAPRTVLLTANIHF
ncbi:MULTISPECIES: catecholate siderophore receptor Fiu [unclassified Achromobacter]|uniref:catecholate siderophore receptor Fiu n=1 Tax=unclassified Achromobacter TaxID=2626865 RepID=UPI000B51D81A|nr:MULTISPECIES: catecholate siderophore receptor Fiu [unclassified Achromobacter]OWT68209.1 TonB-dependent siderophore receptor [Achromobacter sp. HZ34]OWT70046.1 TonB-dependent siderophore receptor [Achromobacter sp. HZ28]